MFVVLVNKQKLSPLTDLMPEILKKFPSEKFSIHGSEEKGYDIRIEGAGCEKLPRSFAEVFIKNWKPTVSS